METVLRNNEEKLEGHTTGIVLSHTIGGTVAQTIGNVITVLMKDPKFKNMFRYNEMTDRIEVQNAWWRRCTVNISDSDLNNIRFYLESEYCLSSEKNIPRGIDIIAHENSYHPVREKLESLTWDKVPRISRLLTKYLGCDETEYTAAAIRIFMLAAISRVFEPGKKFDTMICLVEDKQGGGKSTICRFLAMKDEWFCDDVKNLDDENVYRKLQGHWICEFSEMLAASNTKTVEAIKAFLSRQKDVYKVPYERYPHDFPRQNVFIGTTNNLDFLPNDKTGNRRFIPIKCHSDRAEVHPMADEKETRGFILQCWAEAMEVFKTGDFSLTFPDHLQAELQETRNDFTPEDPKVGVIQEWLDNCSCDAVCTLMIYRECLGNEYGTPQRWELLEIANILTKEIDDWEKYPTSDSKKRFPKYGKQRAWTRKTTQKGRQGGFIPIEEGAPDAFGVF